MKLTDSQKWLVLASILFLGWMLYLLAPVLTPFFIGALLAYIGDPFADRLEAWGLSRTWSVVVVFVTMTLLMVGALLVLLPLLQKQLALLAATLPEYARWSREHILPWLEQTLGVDFDKLHISFLTDWLTGHLGEAGDIATTVFSYLKASSGAVLGWVANLVLIPVVTFYLLRDWDHFMAGIAHLLPRSLEPAVVRVAKESDEMLGAFLRGQITVMIALGTVYATGLWLVGLKFALLIGLIAGMVSFVPYLGFIIGILIAGVATIFQTHDVYQLIPVFAVFAIGQMLEGMVLTPLLVGDKIGLHPVAVIFAVLAGGQLFGFLGVLLALPAAAVIAVIVRDLHRRYMQSAMYHSIDDDDTQAV